MIHTPPPSPSLLTTATGSLAEGEAPKSLIFGIMRLGRALVALPAAAIREVVPCPAQLSTLATPSDCLRGAIELRAEAIPVVDVARYCGQEPCGEGNPLVVILWHEEQLVGLMADGVSDIATIRPQDLRPLRHASMGGNLLVTGTFMLAGQLVNVIDPSAILALPGVPHVGAANHDNSALAGRIVRPNVVFRSGGICLSVPAHEVDATVPESPIIASPLMVGDCEGILHYHGLEVPLIDTVSAFGIGHPPPRPRRAAAIILRFPDDGLLALRIDEVVDIARQDENDILSMPPGLISRGDLYRGIYVNKANERVLVLDAEACRAEPDFLQLASLTKPIGAALKSATAAKLATTEGPAQSAEDDAPQHYLLANCGLQFATLVDAVSEVIGLPEAAHHANPGGDGFLCAINHRNRVVPIYSLARLMWAEPSRDTTRAAVLLVRMGQVTVGFAVNELHSIRRASLFSRGKGAHGIPRTMEALDTILLQEGDRRPCVPVIDLTAIARTLGGGFGGAAASGSGSGGLDPALAQAAAEKAALEDAFFNEPW